MNIAMLGQAQGFYYELHGNMDLALKLATELVEWVDSYGGKPPMDDSLLSHDYWDHIMIPSRPFLYKNWAFIPPTPEGEACTAIVQQVRRAVQTGDEYANVFNSPAGVYEYVLLFRYNRNKNSSVTNEAFTPWVEDLIKFYREL